MKNIDVLRNMNIDETVHNITHLILCGINTFGPRVVQSGEINNFSLARVEKKIEKCVKNYLDDEFKEE